MADGEIRFQQLFLRSAATLLETDQLRLGEYVLALDRWDASKRILTTRDKARHYANSAAAAAAGLATNTKIE